MAAESKPASLLKSKGLWITVMLAVVGVGFVISMRSKKGTTYFTSAVKTGNIVSTVQATGVVNPIHTVQIGAQISGKITKINVDFNSRVTANQLIAQIDPTVYQNALDSAKADLANAEATVQSAQAQVGVAQAAVITAQAGVDKAQANLTQAALQKDRTVGLFQSGIDSAQQRDQDVATWQSDEADLESARASLTQSQAQLKAAQAAVTQAEATVKGKQSAVQTAQTNLDYCNIYAPVDGVIIDRAVDVGQTVASSLQTPTLFSEATDLNTMWVYTQTDESDEGRLKDGDEATFTVDAYPTVVYHGKVLQRRMFATTVQNVVEYDTIVEFQNPGEKVFPGMTAYVNIPVARANNVMELPNSALRFKPEYTPAQLRDVLAQYGIQDTAAAAPAADASSSSGGNGGGRGGHAGANGADASRPTVGLVWKLGPHQELIPVQVRTTITDFTNTAVLNVVHGDLKPGDNVITGELVPKNAASALPGASVNTGTAGRGGR